MAHRVAQQSPPDPGPPAPDARASHESRALAVIPARWDSTRLVGKALADLAGEPMVVRVARRVAQARRVDGVVVATDDSRIEAAVRHAGISVQRTSAHHRSGTDRVAEVARGHGASIILNVQGDEPLVEPETIDALVAAMDDPAVDVATVAAPLVGDPHDPATVKVVLDRRDYALYFSREPIPTGGPFLHHQGLYVFRKAALTRFTSLAPTPLEEAERLEQLRLLEHGLAVRVVRVSHSPPSVDTPEDLERVRRLLART